MKSILLTAKRQRTHRPYCNAVKQEATMESVEPENTE